VRLEERLVCAALREGRESDASIWTTVAAPSEHDSLTVTVLIILVSLSADYFGGVKP